MVEEETFGGDPKGGVEKKSQERESEFHSIPSISRRSRYDKTTVLLQNSRGERREYFLCALEWRGDLYSSSGKNMNEMSFNEGWKRIKKNQEPRPYFRLWGKQVH